MTEDNPLSELDAPLQEAVDGLISAGTDLSAPPADLNQQVLLQIEQTDSQPSSSPPRSEGEFGNMAKVVFGIVVASLLFVGAIFGLTLAGRSFTFASSQPAPGMTFPPGTISDFAELQAIRNEGRQPEIGYLALELMPEFMESPLPIHHHGPPETVPQMTFDEPWRPNRDKNSHRLAFLSEFKNLKGLNVTSLYLTQADLETISGLKSLEKLSLYGVMMLEEDSARRLNWTDIATLKSLTQLRELDLSQSRFEGCSHSLATLPNLESLYICTSEHMNDRSLRELQLLPKLSKLAIAPAYHSKESAAIHAISDAGLESLREFPALKELLIAPFNDEMKGVVRKARKMLPNVQVRETNQAALLPIGSRDEIR